MKSISKAFDRDSRLRANEACRFPKNAEKLKSAYWKHHTSKEDLSNNQLKS